MRYSDPLTSSPQAAAKRIVTPACGPQHHAKARQEPELGWKNTPALFGQNSRRGVQFILTEF